MNTIDVQAKNYAAENLNETDENRKVSIEQLKLWLENEVPWLNARTEDRYLLSFLRGCKFNLEKTKQKLVNYYTMKRDCPEWFEQRNPQHPVIQELIKRGVFLPLKQHHDNKLVVVIRTAAHDPKLHTWDDVFKAGKMVLDVACMENELVQIYGVIAIFDMTGMSFAHYKTMTPGLIKKSVFAWQNYHVRPKQLEFINSPTYITVALNIFKSFMSQKMRNRVRVHFGGVTEAQNIVETHNLPPEYGGQGDNFESLGSYWFKKVSDYKDWFIQDEKYRAATK